MKASELTLDEKIKLVTGRDLWHIDRLNNKLPEFSVTDGPCGMRKMILNDKGYWEEVPSNGYVSPVSLANSWNKDLVKLQGELIAEDCIEADKDVILAPGVNMKRTPLCGRNFEYYSEDPFLAGTLAKSFIEGVQGKGIGTSLKHFAVNNREVRRFNQSSDIDERTLHEIYLEAFRIALKAKPLSVMTSYNPVNGIYASENKHLIQDILRDEFGYDGLVISDWLGVHNSARALKAGLNLRMPFDRNAENEIRKGLENGIITENDLNENVQKILDTLEINEANKKLRKVNHTSQERLAKALEIAQESIVLLKNENNVLPLNKNETVFVSGQLDERPHTSGSGSARVRCNPIQKRVSSLLLEEGYKCTHAEHNFLDSCNPSHIDRETVELSQEYDVTILLVGTGEKIEGEGFDRTNIKLPEKEETLIKKTAMVANKLIVVVEAGSAIDMSEWIDVVDAVVFAGYLGENENQAISDILTGKVNPSGKLSETFPYSLDDTYLKDNAGEGDFESYSEKLFLGYRYFDFKEIEPLFEFGYGLSYTTFEYKDLCIKQIDVTTFEVNYKVTNTGKVPGKEISQVYVCDVTAMVPREIKSLKGYSKDLIQPGETKEIKITLDRHAFEYYDVNNKEYYVENGYFYVLVGPSSLNIKLEEKIKIELNEKDQHSKY